MKILVLGSSGGCGQQVVMLALDLGFEVTAVVRQGSSYQPPPKIKLLRGDLKNESFLTSCLDGQDAVLSALGPKRVNPKNPWSRLDSEETFASESAQALVRAMHHSGVKRVCAISAAGVADSYPHMNAVMKFFVKTSTVGKAYRDLARMEAIYATSGLDWQTVRPTRLTPGPLTKNVRQVEAFSLTAAISRADVAYFMLQQLASAPFSPRTPSITGA